VVFWAVVIKEKETIYKRAGFGYKNIGLFYKNLFLRLIRFLFSVGGCLVVGFGLD